MLPLISLELLVAGIVCFLNAIALVLLYKEMRHRSRRLSDRILHLSEIVTELNRDLQRVEQAHSLETARMRTPSPRRAAEAHANALRQREMEREETAHLPDVHTKRIERGPHS